MHAGSRVTAVALAKVVWSALEPPGYQVSDTPPPPGDATGVMVTRVSCPIVTVQPETMPTAAPNATSLRKCRLS
jgi:hypothetical protein